jgi:hypothetical protein
MTIEPPRDRDPVPRFLGWVLLVVGVLWMATAGICTVAVLVQSGSGEEGLRLLFAGIGVIAGGAGFGVFVLGRWLARN